MQFGRIREDYLSKGNTDCLKGICAVFVLICHFRMYIPEINNFAVTKILIGSLAVAIFFFLSGYGLMYSYENKGQDYIKAFPVRRILPFYCTNIILIILYAVFFLAIGKPVDSKSFIMSFLFGKTIIIHGWYVQAILVLYILYFIVFSIKTKNNFKIIIYILALVLYSKICLSLNLGLIWIQSVFAMPLGMIWYRYKNKIDSFIAKGINYYIVFILSTVVVVICLLLEFAIKQPYIFILINKIIYSAFFIVLTMLFTMKVNICGRVTKQLGKIYYEIYVTQGLILTLLRSDLIYINNSVLYAFVGIVLILAASVLLHLVFDKINSVANNIYKLKTDK